VAIVNYLTPKKGYALGGRQERCTHHTDVTKYFISYTNFYESWNQ